MGPQRWTREEGRSAKKEEKGDIQIMNINTSPAKTTKTSWISASMLACALALPGFSIVKAHAAPPQAGAYEQGGWDTPPGEFREVQRQGFHDGIEGARKDFDNHRPPNVRNEYRHPHVDPSLRDDYREGFRRGYDVAMRHLASH